MEPVAVEEVPKGGMLGVRASMLVSNALHADPIGYKGPDKGRMVEYLANGDTQRGHPHNVDRDAL